MTELAVLAENVVAVSGQGLRQLMDAPLGEGAYDRAAMLPTVPGSTYTVSIAPGVCWVRGDSLTSQGLYRVENDASKDTSAFAGGAIPAAHATNPRLDQIIARVYDHDADGSGQRKWQLEVVPGTATAGATLDNRTGAAALPTTAMLICDVLVPAAATALAAGDIRDRRPFATKLPPPVFSAANQVPMEPLAPLQPRPSLLDSTHNNLQAAAPFVLPRRMVGATRIRWKYAQGATALTGNYNIGIADASGRIIVSTGSIALAGAAGAFQNKSDPIAATTFEGGVYWAVIGVASLAGGAVTYQGITLALRAAALGSDPATVLFGVPSANYGGRAGSGGITMPSTILGFTNLAAQGTPLESPPVPMASLSVS